MLVGEILGQRPVEAGEQDLEALRGQAARFLGSEERLARAGNAQDERSAMRGEHIERIELLVREADAGLVGSDTGGQRRGDL